jgi:methylisocitrate lyase
MTYLVADDLPRAPAGERLRELLRHDAILEMPGAYNGLAALQAKAQGFEALYLSGAALNVMHMVRSFEDAGAAAVHIEDQLLPKKCGHLNDKKLASPHDMAAKIAAAVRARRHLYIIARTDAAGSEGIDGAVARAKLYLEAGADAIFPEALTTAEMFREFARRVQAPLLANMTEFGRTPYLTAREFEAMGYRMLIWPVSALRMAAKAHETLYAALKRDGGAHNVIGQMQTRQELYQTIGYAEYEALDASIVKTVLPS